MSDPSHILRIARTKGLPYCNHPRIPSRTLYALGYSARPDLMDPGHWGALVASLWVHDSVESELHGKGTGKSGPDILQHDSRLTHCPIARYNPEMR